MEKKSTKKVKVVESKKEVGTKVTYDELELHFIRSYYSTEYISAYMNDCDYMITVTDSQKELIESISNLILASKAEVKVSKVTNLPIVLLGELKVNTDYNCIEVSTSRLAGITLPMQKEAPLINVLVVSESMELIMKYLSDQDYLDVNDIVFSNEKLRIYK